LVDNSDNSNPVSNGKTCEDGNGLPNNHNEVACQNVKTDMLEASETCNDLDNKGPMSNAPSFSEPALADSTEPRGSKRPNESEELNDNNKKSRTVIIDSDGETHSVKDNSLPNALTWTLILIPKKISVSLVPILFLCRVRMRSLTVPPVVR
jgi:hypothetical protein